MQFDKVTTLFVTVSATSLYLRDTVQGSHAHSSALAASSSIAASIVVRQQRFMAERTAT